MLTSTRDNARIQTHDTNDVTGEAGEDVWLGRELPTDRQNIAALEGEMADGIGTGFK